MKLVALMTITTMAALQAAEAFVPMAEPRGISRRMISKLAATMDADELLRKAAQLKAEAAAAEQALHEDLLGKKQQKNDELDGFIDKLFPQNDESMEGLVGRLKQNHWSTDRLLLIAKRLHEREIAAQGKGHVQASLHHDHTRFESVSQGNPEELARVQGKVDKLLEAAEIIDEEFMAEKRKLKDQKYLSHVDLDHWTVGDLAGNLRRQVGELRREHEEQFQERLESFYEAQRKEKKHPKPDEKKP